MSRLSVPVESGCPAKTFTSSTKVPDGQSGPVAVKVLKPVSKLTCSVIVNGTGAAACADAAAPSGASKASATATALMMRLIMTPGGLRKVVGEPVDETGCARTPTIRACDPRTQVGPRYCRPRHWSMALYAATTNPPLLSPVRGGLGHSDRSVAMRDLR